MKKKCFIPIFLALAVYFCLFNVQKINLTTADIGRHVKNGEIILHASEYGANIASILHTNFFSTTYPDFPFVNHHWGSGVIAYIIYGMSGWDGLSIVYILLMLVALFFSVKTAAEKSPPYIW